MYQRLFRRRVIAFDSLPGQFFCARSFVCIPHERKQVSKSITAATTDRRQAAGC
jgi:hypothetical protein